MKALEFVNPARLFVEIGQDWLKAFNGTASVELPLERSADGRLKEGCKGGVAARLQEFIQHKIWQPRPRVFCAIGSRGVSFRRFSLPAASKEELQRLVALQIESDFPLPPEQLAWGCQALNGSRLHPPGQNGKQDVLVAAVKKDSLDDYASLFALCGANPVFTLAALARSYVCPQPSCPYAVLAIDRSYSELISFDDGVPVAVRVLPWGSANLAGSSPGPNQRSDVQNQPSLLSGTNAKPATYGGSVPVSTQPTSVDPLDQLARLINGQSEGRRIYVTWVSNAVPGLDVPGRLRSFLGDAVDCLAVDLDTEPAGSTAILGLQKIVDRPEGWPPLVLETKPANGKPSRIAQRAPLKWVGAAAALLLAALLLPYGEALVLKGHVAKKLAAIKSDQGRLAIMDRELDFLQYLQQSQPPYLDALVVLSKAAPPGTRFDSVSMNRRGELALRGSLHDGQQAAELRSKLIDSGFFESVGIEEQTPSPDHQKVTIRMNAQWKPAGSRTKPALEPGRPAGAKSSANPAVPGAVVASTNTGPPVKAPVLKKGPQ